MGDPGEEAGRQIGQRHADADGQEDGQGLCRRQADRQTQRGPHEGRRAGRCHRHRQHAGQEGIRQRVAQLQPGQRWRQHAAEIEQAGQVQADHSEQQRQPGHHRRILQLEAPAQLFARRPQRQQQAAQRQEGQQHASGVGQPGPTVRAPVIGMAREGHHLDRQHGKHAGHQVQDQPARQRAEQRSPQADVARRAGTAGSAGACALRGLRQRLLQGWRDFAALCRGRPFAFHRHFHPHPCGLFARACQRQHERDLARALNAVR